MWMRAEIVKTKSPGRDVNCMQAYQLEYDTIDLESVVNVTDRLSENENESGAMK